jgi:copper resistance protein D
LSDLLVALRAVHFAATVLLAGTLVFAVVVVGPARRSAHPQPPLDAWYAQSTRMAWWAVATAILSGAAWLVVLAADIGGQPLNDVFSGDIVWRVLTRTRFGFAWSARFFLALWLVIGLLVLGRRSATSRRWLGLSLVVVALSFLGSLAWSGHASGTPGIPGSVHIAADGLHLVAAGTWTGGLVPLALLLAAARRATDSSVASIARAATLRFSTLGVIAVGTLLVTGVANAWVLVGSVPALVGTEYGRLLMVKIGLFIAMICVAAFNRLRLTPQLSSVRTAADAQRRLQRNSLIELAMGLLILVIVGALGTLPPGLHAMPSTHVHGS